MDPKCSKSTSLAPGFRFHPTDEELVWYYLKRKVSGKPFRVDAISEIDIYKVEPSDLPGLSKLKTRDQEWYFFSALDRKYGNGSRTNRATNEGYWKTTGKDRPVYHKCQVVGMKKTLVYHKGRAPRGERSNWVMHEYKLNDDVPENVGISPDGFVLCRVFQKSGTGPKNGEQYGAPLVEEEWEDSGEPVVPGEVSFDDPYVDDDAYIEEIDFDQVLELPENIHSSVSFNHVEGNNYIEESQDMSGANHKSVEESDGTFTLETLDGQNFDDVARLESIPCVVKNEHMAQPNDLSNEAAVALDDLLTDSVNVPFDDELYLDSHDLHPRDFDVLESNWDDLDFDIGSYLNDDCLPELMDKDLDEGFADHQNVNNETWEMPLATQQLPGIDDNGSGSSSHQTMEIKDIQSPCMTRANRSLSNISGPSAFASEKPSKDMGKHLSAFMPSTPVHVTAGMVRIREMPIGVRENGLQWSFDKNGIISVRLSFDLPQTLVPAELDSLTGFLPKTSTATSRRWLCFMLFLIFVFGLSVKIRTCIYAK
ncbi:unnamed protein product [Amaranthus hypochondriacus]